jgi:hypothetical protein
MQAADYLPPFESAARRLQAKGLLQPGDALSCRVPGAGVFMHRAWTEDGGAGDIQQRPLNAPTGAEDELHRLIYLARPDVGAVLLCCSKWASALPAASPMPGIFDEQLRHLGWCVKPLEPVCDAEGARTQLADGGNAYTLGAQALCLGMTLERLVFNAELLEKCAKAYLLASASGLPVGRIPWLVRWIATGRLRKDQKRAAEHHERGLAPPRSAGY